MEEQRQKELEGLCRQLGMVMEDLHLEPNGEESPWNRRMREIKDKRKK